MNDDDVNAEKVNNNDVDDNVLNELSNMNIDSNRYCLYCLQVVEGCSRCSQCRTALYCNTDCQLKHWPVHKNICQDSNKENSDQKLNIVVSVEG